MSQDPTQRASLDCIREWNANLGLLADSSDSSASKEFQQLCHVIEADIVPRLMMLLDSESLNPSPEFDRSDHSGVTRRPSIRPSDIPPFVEILLHNDASVAVDFIVRQRESGAQLPQIYLELMAPAARRLGQMWEADECNFTEVTIGMSRLHQVLMHFSTFFRDGGESTNPDRANALIVPLPGEQHTFGLHMVVEFFRRSGWDVSTGCPQSCQQLEALVSKAYYSVLGYSVSAERHLDTLRDQIRRIRAASRNPDLVILVGGNLFNENPDLSAQVGADGTASSGPEAVRLAKLFTEQGE